MIAVDYDPLWKHIVEGILLKDGYNGGKWFVKHSALYGKIWKDFNPFWVLVRRSEDAILDSIRRKNPNDNKPDHFWRILIQNHNNIMDEIMEDHPSDSYNINSDLLIENSYIDLTFLFEGIGHTLDHEITSKIIQPEIWGVTV